ncbi:MAG TPA: hypothetical protein PLV56_09705 [Synergistales bacterium]|nr:hypothetical protein [Synergistales bacterium]
MDKMERQDFEMYRLLRDKLEHRCERLCRLYAEQYYDVDRDDRQIYINNVELGKSGRILINFSDGTVEEMLYLPPEYLWRTDEEVKVLMRLDRDRKEEDLKNIREQHEGK